MIQKFEADGSQRDGEAALQEEEVGYAYLWDCFVGKEVYVKEDVHLCTSKKTCKSEMACI